MSLDANLALHGIDLVLVDLRADYTGQRVTLRSYNDSREFQLRFTFEHSHWTVNLSLKP